MDDLRPDVELDLRGLPCPLPTVEVSRRIGELPEGGVLRAVTSSSGSLADLAAWARATGHEIVSARETDGDFVFLIRRTG